MNITEMNQTMACTFYYSDCATVFEKYDKKVIQRLAKEVSALSLVLPFHYLPEQYKKGEVMKALDAVNEYEEIGKVEHLSAFNDNYVSVLIDGKTVKERVTLMYLTALLGYCVNRLSGGQLKDKVEFVKMGEYLKG